MINYFMPVFLFLLTLSFSAKASVDFAQIREEGIQICKSMIAYNEDNIEWYKNKEIEVNTDREKDIKIFRFHFNCDPHYPYDFSKLDILKELGSLIGVCSRNIDRFNHNMTLWAKINNDAVHNTEFAEKQVRIFLEEVKTQQAGLLEKCILAIDAGDMFSVTNEKVHKDNYKGWQSWVDSIKLFSKLLSQPAIEDLFQRYIIHSARKPSRKIYTGPYVYSSTYMCLKAYFLGLTDTLCTQEHFLYSYYKINPSTSDGRQYFLRSTFARDAEMLETEVMKALNPYQLKASEASSSSKESHLELSPEDQKR
ncbi:MAG: hypothetical protein ACK5PQ_02195 [Alphaproteobacteria bacterium]